MTTADEQAVRLGIAITTYNRCQMVLELVLAIRKLTTGLYDLIVCDDGSSDQTVEVLRSVGCKVIQGKNRGIAWNKNRGIFYLKEIKKCDYIILLDDDVYPESEGWNLEWIEACRVFGHVNFSLPFCREEILGGDSNSTCPGLTKKLGGCALAFQRSVLSSIGYMDPRFRKYGHEHTDLTIRSIRAGWGGITLLDSGVEELLFFVINGGLSLRLSNTTGTTEFIEENSEIWRSIMGDQIYRHAWRNDLDRIDFLGEILQCIDLKSPINSSFHSAEYISLYADVAKSGAKPLDHYIRFGIREGRKGIKSGASTITEDSRTSELSISQPVIDDKLSNNSIPDDRLGIAAKMMGLPWPIPPIEMDDFDWTNFEHPFKKKFG